MAAVFNVLLLRRVTRCLSLNEPKDEVCVLEREYGCLGMLVEAEVEDGRC